MSTIYEFPVCRAIRSSHGLGVDKGLYKVFWRKPEPVSFTCRFPYPYPKRIDLLRSTYVTDCLYARYADIHNYWLVCIPVLCSSRAEFGYKYEKMSNVNVDFRQKSHVFSNRAIASGVTLILCTGKWINAIHRNCSCF